MGDRGNRRSGIPTTALECKMLWCSRPRRRGNATIGIGSGSGPRVREGGGGGSATGYRPGWACTYSTRLVLNDFSEASLMALHASSVNHHHAEDEDDGVTDQVRA